MASSAAIPQYYELSWAILSTIGLTNVLVGLMVMGIVGCSRVALVPLVVSVATAVANGMCFYAFYADYPMVNTAVASAFGDVCWLVQEAGLSFYSYVILVRVLLNRERLIFMVLFWTLITTICSIRVAILVSRLRYILDGSSESELQSLIDHLHVGYFSCIAVVEILSAVFLLKTFNSARRFTLRSALRSGVFSYMMRSTEIRLALLAVVGVTRAVTYSFQATAQSAEGVAGQLDRFAYTLECLFPVVMFIDILASRLVFANDGRSHETSSNSRSRRVTANRRGTNRRSETVPGSVPMYLVSQNGRRDAKHDHNSSDATSSQEHIIDSTGTTSEIEAGGARGVPIDQNGINKTVGFEISEHRIAVAR